MSPALKKMTAAVSAVGAIAAAGGAAFLLIRRAPNRQVFRTATGWTSALPQPRTRMPTVQRSVSSSAVAPSQSTKTIEPAKPTQPGWFGAIKELVSEFLADDVLTQAAALAFYTGLAMAPILTVAAWAARIFLPPSQKWDVAKAFSDVMGKQAYEPIKDLLGPTSQQAELSMTAAGLVSLALVLFSASGVFGQVQSALNTIWHVQARPANGLIGFVQKRAISFGMLISILFLLLASLVISVTLTAAATATGLSEMNVVGQVMSFVATIVVFTAVFAAMFKFVPDVRIDWKPVWVGGFIAATLFAVGKLGLSFYLGKGSYETSYGAAVGSFVALLVWVYYSAVILLIGAESTAIYARRCGHRLEPDKHAVKVIQLTEPA